MRTRICKTLAVLLFSAFLSPILGGDFAGAQDVPQNSQSQSQSQSQEQERGVRLWVSELEKHGLSVEMGKMSFDEQSDATELYDLVVSSADAGDSKVPARDGRGYYRVQIGKLVIKSLSVDGDGVSFASANAEDVALTSTGPENAPWLRFAHLDLTQVYLPSFAAFRADASRPVSSQISFLRLLSKASVTRIVASNIDVESEMQFEQLTLSDIQDGKVSTGEFKGIQASLPGDPASAQEPTRIELSSVLLTNGNLDPYLRLFEATAYTEAGFARPWRNLIDSLRLNDVRFERGPISVDLGAIEFGALKVRQFEKYLTDIFDQASVDRTFLSKNPEAAGQFRQAISQSFAIGNIDVANANATVPVSDGTGQLHLAAAAVSNLLSNHMDELKIDSLKYSDTTRDIGLRELVLKDVNLPARQFADAAIVEQVSPVGVPRVSGVTASGLNVETKAEGSAGVFSLDKFDLGMSYFIGATPTNVTLGLDNLKLGVEQVGIPGLRETLKDLGYDKLDVSLKLSAYWQEATSEIAVDTFSLTGAEIGTLSASGSITGVSRAGIERPATVLPVEVSAGGLKNFRLSFQNKSLFERFLNVVAKQNSRTVEELTKALSANMPAILARIEPSLTRNKFIFSAVSFVNEPIEFAVLTTTTDIVAISDVLSALREPWTLPGLLKLDARANGRS